MTIARGHIVNLRQCSLFVDSEPIKRAMTDAADFIEALKKPLDEVRYLLDNGLPYYGTTNGKRLHAILLAYEGGNPKDSTDG